MRSGTAYAATDFFENQSQRFEFTASRVSGTRKVKINWWVTTECNDSAASPTYYLCYGTQKLTVNGSLHLNWTGTNPYYINSSGNTVYYGFTDSGSWLDNNYDKREFYDTNGDYTGIRRYIKVLGTKWTSGSFELTANSQGSVSFTVEGNFGWYGKTGLNFYKSFTIDNLIPTETYTISFATNTHDRVKGAGNRAQNMPDNITKSYGVNVNIPSNIPVVKDENGNITYDFKIWADSATSSFEEDSSAKTWIPGAVYSDNKSSTLYAIWSKSARQIRYDLNGGFFVYQRTVIDPRTSNPLLVNTYYSDTITLLGGTKGAYITKYGCSLTGWKDSSGTLYPSGSDYFVKNNETLTAYYTGNLYTITLCDEYGNTIRTLQNDYGKILTGDFTYSTPGYTCVGWTTNSKSKKYNVTDELPPVIENLDSLSSVNVLNDYMYIGCGKYTVNSPYIIDESSSTSRLHIIGDDVKLYPILVYDTSFYIFDSNSWKLAMPYVFDNGSWKQCAGYVFDNTWKR